MNKKFISLIIVILVAIALITYMFNVKKTNPTTIQAFCFNTYISITIYDEVPENVEEECLKLANRYELMFSRTNPESELYKLNKKKSMNCSEELVEVISIGKHYSEISNGAFDITIGKVNDLWNFTTTEGKLPENQLIKDALSSVDYTNISIDGSLVTLSNDASIDLGAIAKGYIADKFKEYLISENINHAIINLGGNILLIGGKSDKEDFTIGIQKPFADRQETIASVILKDISVVSTGIYERCFTADSKFYHHILNPKTGYPYENTLTSVTIFAKDSTTCDALSTTCFCLGLEDGLALIDSTPDVYGVFITKDGNVIYSKDFPY